MLMLTCQLTYETQYTSLRIFWTIDLCYVTTAGEPVRMLQPGVVTGAPVMQRSPTEVASHSVSVTCINKIAFWITVQNNTFKK